MTVTPYDRLRFQVTSERDSSIEYIVDLSEDPYTCECPNFVCLNKKKLGADCKHIRRVISYLARQVIEALRAQELDV